MNPTYRLAEVSDIPSLDALIPLSVRGLQTAFYTPTQIEEALGTVFGVDSQLIRDRTYFVAEISGQLVACGGWSQRTTSYGSDRAKTGEESLRDPRVDPAVIRAFFVHPAHSRKGIGRQFLAMCEAAIIDAGYSSVEMVATLAGEPLYAAGGYLVSERFTIPLRSGDELAVVKMTKGF